MQLFIDSDPFLKLRPFYEQTETSNEFWNHWHEIVASALFYHFIMLISPAINTWCFGKNYTSIEKRKLKLNFDIHIVALVQSTASIFMAVPMFFHPMLKTNPVLGEYDFAYLVASMTTGYFIWDLFYCCVFHFDLFGVQFLFHAVAALIVFVSTFKPFCGPLIPYFLIFELSTPFVNLNWLFSRLPAGSISDRVYTINGLLLMATFFGSRIVWGFIAAAKVFFLCKAQKDEIPLIIACVVGGLNIGLDFLNLFWFKKMVGLAIRKFSGSASTKEVKKELEQAEGEEETEEEITEEIKVEEKKEK